MVNLLLKQTPCGERAFPVNSEDLKIMEALDEVEQVSKNPLVYRVKVDTPATAEKDEPQVYQTKDMVARPNARRTRKNQ